MQIFLLLLNYIICFQDRHYYKQINERKTATSSQLSMAMAGAFIFSADLSPLFRRDMISASGKTKRSPILKRLAASTEQRSSPTTVRTTTARETRSSFVEKKSSSEEAERIRGVNVEEEPERNRKSFKDYFEEAKDMIRSDGGPPRWFSPLECGSHAPDCPLLLYMPGLSVSLFLLLLFVNRFLVTVILIRTFSCGFIT